LISKISSTCFGQSFAHLQERNTEIFTAYGIVSCCCGRQGCATLPLTEPLPTTTTGHYTICCKNLSLTLVNIGKYCPKHVELILEINKLLLLHLVGFSILLYLNSRSSIRLGYLIKNVVKICNKTQEMIGNVVRGRQGRPYQRCCRKCGFTSP